MATSVTVNLIHHHEVAPPITDSMLYMRNITYNFRTF